MTQPEAAAITLGLLAGGAASRLGGLDKAWLVRDGTPQVVRRLAELRHAATQVLVSANRDAGRYAGLGVAVVPDLRPGLPGPLGGLEALARACATPWLLTAPVDVVELPADSASRLIRGAGATGSYAVDSRGPQPLVALWRVDALRAAAGKALDAGRNAVRPLQAEIGMHAVDFGDACFGNLNTPEDLLAGRVRR